MLFSHLIDTLFNLLGFDTAKIVLYLNDFALRDEPIDGIIGWMIYYPTYFLLHLIFIYLLFSNQIKTRNYLLAGLTIVVFLLVSISIISKILEHNAIHKISYEAFQKLFGLPFILLFIEGGRILYKDVMGNSMSNTQNQ
jgi:hypothetical protein